jgi:hypothetical protein
VSAEPIEDVLARYTPQWLATEGVVGTAIGRHQGEPCMVVFATERTQALDRSIPPTVEGYRVVVEVAGPFRALPRGGSPSA